MAEMELLKKWEDRICDEICCMMGVCDWKPTHTAILDNLMCSYEKVHKIMKLEYEIKDLEEKNHMESSQR